VADFATVRSGTLTIKVLTDDKVVRIEGAGVSRDRWQVSRAKG
jgi:hypothetical protein